MDMRQLPAAERIHIGFFGKRNAGKSSLVNAVTGQSLSVVSDVAGTTTDTVRKAMELLPLGPVVILDTPGFDDEGALGSLRVAKTREALSQSDIAVLVTETDDPEADPFDRALIGLFQEKGLPCLVVHSKQDRMTDAKGAWTDEKGIRHLKASAKEGLGIEALKEALGAVAPEKKEPPLASDLVVAGDVVVLVCPLDESAPKGRLILPQQMVLRDLMEAGCVPLVVREHELSSAFSVLRGEPALVITDSQVFAEVAAQMPERVRLTSFSILMARYKGFLETALRGAAALYSLSDGDRVLMAEGCTHHRQCGDIGTVKIPRWLRSFAGVDLLIDTCSGNAFPEDLSPYAAVIHCGGCMITETQVRSRMYQAIAQGVPFSNYGIAIAAARGILPRALSPFPNLLPLLPEKIRTE